MRKHARRVPLLQEGQVLLGQDHLVLPLRLQRQRPGRIAERRQRDQGAADPHHADHHGHRGLGPELEADEAEVEDGGRAQQHVQGRVHLAPDVPEYPVAHNLMQKY
ncbi:unnamed protein product [Sphagnum tenellum]